MELVSGMSRPRPSSLTNSRYPGNKKIDFVFYRNFEFHFVVSFGVAAWHYICMVFSGRSAPSYTAALWAGQCGSVAWPVGRWQMGEILGPQLATDLVGRAGALDHLSL